ncbi:GNAT family N-acetyltransferase [Mycobacterium spongiae]|nr:GNAT family N-acetyltransferase [Mycobacterium spongiae]
MPDGISLRQAGPADYENVAEMHYPSWRSSYRGIMTPQMLDLFDTQKWIDEEYPQRLTRPGWAMWLAEAQGRIIGMSIFGPEIDNPDHLEVDSLYVAAGSERRGIGGLLLDHALSSEPSHDAVVWCAERNFRARRFYQKKGFQLDGRSFTWTLVPGLIGIPQLGFTLRRAPAETVSRP